MKQIRHSVFETNSSSTHSLTMCTKQEFNDFNSGKLFINNMPRHYIKEYPTMLNVDQLRKIGILLSKDENMSKWYDEDFENMSDEELIEYFLDNDDIYDSDYFENDDLEYFEEEYTTPNGETIVAFGQYGYDG